MTEEEFLQKAVLNAIRLLRPGDWCDTGYNDRGVKLVYDFAKKLTDKVYEKPY